MTYQADLALTGAWGPTAVYMAGGVLDNNVSLTGSTGTNGTSTGSSAGAYQITKDTTFINAATSSSAGNAAILPGNKGSASIVVFNNTAFTIWVFAPVNGFINNYASAGMVQNVGNSFAGAFQIAANKSACFFSADGNTWLAQHAG